MFRFIVTPKQSRHEVLVPDGASLLTRSKGVAMAVFAALIACTAMPNYDSDTIDYGPSVTGVFRASDS